jgi:hypothetical protein
MMVSLSAPASGSVTAVFTTKPGTATSADLRPLAGLAEIPSGKTRAIIRIPVFGDTEKWRKTSRFWRN